MAAEDLKRRNAVAWLVPTVLFAAGMAHGQQDWLDRLPADELDALSPAARVQGAPGSMRIVERTCRNEAGANLRQRIADIAIQEWGFFGFTVLDQTNEPEAQPAGIRRPWRPRAWLDPAESARVAPSIAGYWAITPDGTWILDRQNDVWNSPEGTAAAWRDPWSAAFISWVMCEAGLGDAERFRRAIAHHAYIDQAIVARDSDNSEAAFLAFEVGEQAIEPGDLLCVARRPAYRTVAERRAQLGTGIRSHCDIVVQVDTTNERILVIGGNVRGSVRLKLHAAEFGQDSGQVTSVGRGRRTVFAHLKLSADSIGQDAFESSPTMRVLTKQGKDLAVLLRAQGSTLAPQVAAGQSYGLQNLPLEGTHNE